MRFKLLFLVKNERPNLPEKVGAWLGQARTNRVFLWCDRGFSLKSKAKLKEKTKLVLDNTLFTLVCPPLI